MRALDGLKEAVRRIVEGWPPPPFRISGRDEGRSPENFWLRPAGNPGRAFQKAFERVLRQCGIHAGRGPAVYRRQMTSCQRSVETVLPNARDRRVPALRSLLRHAPLFYRSELEKGGLRGLASSFAPDKLLLNGRMALGSLRSAAPTGTTGFRERSSLSIITARACRSAAERSAARIPTRWTSPGRCGRAA